MGRSLLTPVLLFWLWNPVWAADPVYFADRHLKAVVEETLWISDPTPEDMLALTVLAAEAKEITSLTGLEYATNLERLWIRWNQISDLSPLSGLTHLRFLDGHGNDVISDISPLAGLTNMETLILRYNRITDVSALSGMTKLEHLHLEWNKIADISALAGLTSLREANLQYNQFSDLSPLLTLRRLLFLDMRGVPLSRVSCAAIIPQIITNNPGIDFRRDACASRRVVLSSTAGGSINSPGEGEFFYDNGETIVLSAEADPGFEFAGFSGTYSTSDNPVSLTIEQDHEIRADFHRPGDPNITEDSPDDSVPQRPLIHVDDDASDDPRPGDAHVSDPWEDGTYRHPFDGIQEAIDVAPDRAIIFVHAGTYREKIDLLGKRILLTGFDPTDANLPRWPLIDGGGTGPVVSFTHGEGPNCVVQGVVITGGKDDHAAAIRCRAGSPIICNCLIVGNRASDPNGAIVYCADSNALFINCTIADNHAGNSSAGLYAVNGHVAVTNSILWDNSPKAVLDLGTGAISISYSDIADGWPGSGNLRTDPLFAGSGYWVDDEDRDATVAPDDPRAAWIMGDYHVRSQAGRWDVFQRQWMKDAVSSPCIDAGNPSNPVGRELFPNGHIINLGAYGGTVEAAKSIRNQ
jgi:Leucine-rich repeat (LRR) protein